MIFHIITKEISRAASLPPSQASLKSLPEFPLEFDYSMLRLRNNDLLVFLTTGKSKLENKIAYLCCR
jgi:hypothetical protein